MVGPPILLSVLQQGGLSNLVHKGTYDDNIEASTSSESRPKKYVLPKSQVALGHFAHPWWVKVAAEYLPGHMIGYLTGCLAGFQMQYPAKSLAGICLFI